VNLAPSDDAPDVVSTAQLGQSGTGAEVQAQRDGERRGPVDEAAFGNPRARPGSDLRRRRAAPGATARREHRGSRSETRRVASRDPATKEPGAIQRGAAR
jgi:hypothetical protein